MDLPLSDSEFILLGKRLTKGIFCETFVVRDKDKFAHSSLYVVKQARWDDDTKGWIISISQAE